VSTTGTQTPEIGGGEDYCAAMDAQLDDEQIDRSAGLPESSKSVIRLENQIAGRYWGGVEWRIVATFAVTLALWIAVIVAAHRGSIPLWLGFVLNTALATTFYMPMHESVHGNISGKVTSMRWLNELVGKLSQVPLLMAHSAHRTSHMKHHAFTNEPGRDPDHFTHGTLSQIPKKWFAVAMVNTFLPLLALIPALRRLLPKGMAESASSDPGAQRSMFRMWLLSTIALVVCAALGVGVEALVLWYVPARLTMFWLMVVFAWYPHHPADTPGRYLDTRVAVFPGSGLLIRGHDHHALHHLYPRVAHYRLRGLWQEMSADLVAKGVRAEGRATNSTRPVVWS
jgi:beta-carotene hydroxylase